MSSLVVLPIGSEARSALPVRRAGAVPELVVLEGADRARRSRRPGAAGTGVRPPGRRGSRNDDRLGLLFDLYL